MNRFAALLDRLAYEPSRNAKLRLLTDYFRNDAGPGSRLRARRDHRRALVPPRQARHHPRADRRAHRPDAVRAVLRLCRRSVRDGRADVAGARYCRPQRRRKRRHSPHVVTTLASLGKSELPAQLAAWLDALDETGRWALLKLVTGALRIGVSARLAKTAVAALGDKEPDEVELVWHGLAPPYAELFAWIEGRAEKPVSIDPAPFRPVMLGHAIEETGLSPRSIRRDFPAEWKWDGIRVQAVAGDGRRQARRAALFAHRRGHLGAFPDLDRRAATSTARSTASC